MSSEKEKLNHKSIILRTICLLSSFLIAALLVGFIVVGICLLVVGYAQKNNYYAELKDPTALNIATKTTCTVRTPTTSCDVTSNTCHAIVDYEDKVGIVTHTAFSADSTYAEYQAGSTHTCYYDAANTNLVSYFHYDTASIALAHWRGQIGVGWSILFTGLFVVIALIITFIIVRVVFGIKEQRDKWNKQGRFKDTKTTSPVSENIGAQTV
jgi:uncharacterized membrane protein